jgi:hypothetical protein
MQIVVIIRLSNTKPSMAKPCEPHRNPRELGKRVPQGQPANGRQQSYSESNSPSNSTLRALRARIRERSSC